MTEEEDPQPSDPAPQRGRRRMLLLAVAAVIIVGMATTATVVAVQDSRHPSLTTLQRGDGTRAPTFRLPDLRDPQRMIELSQFAGRPVILNFWASWCVPCRREMPAFQQVHEQYGDRVTILGVDNQDARTAAIDLLDETGATYPSMHDPAGELARAYGLVGMPTTVFISADGKRLGTRTGELHADELERLTQQLLDDPRTR